MVMQTSVDVEIAVGELKGGDGGREKGSKINNVLNLKRLKPVKLEPLKATGVGEEETSIGEEPLGLIVTAGEGHLAAMLA